LTTSRSTRIRGALVRQVTKYDGYGGLSTDDFQPDVSDHVETVTYIHARGIEDGGLQQRQPLPTNNAVRVAFSSRPRLRRFTVRAERMRAHDAYKRLRRRSARPKTSAQFMSQSYSGGIGSAISSTGRVSESHRFAEFPSLSTTRLAEVRVS
jgi:hypothetical protein